MQTKNSNKILIYTYSDDYYQKEKMTSVRKDVEKLEHFARTGIQNGEASVENSLALHQENKQHYLMSLHFH